jgi:hypothetical protein
MAKKKKSDIPSQEEIAELVDRMAHILDYEAIREDRDIRTDAERLQDYKKLRDIIDVKLKRKILKDEMSGSCALTSIIERVDLIIDRLDDSKDTRDNSITISFASNKKND